MRRKLAFILIAFSAACTAQQQPPTTAPPAPQTVFHAGPGIVAPELIPPQISLQEIHHCSKLDGKPVLSTTVDAQGNISSPVVSEPADGRLNEAALALVALDRFKPGTHDGVPAVVAIQIAITLKTCRPSSPEADDASTLASLRDQPIQIVTVTPPLSPEIEQALAQSHGAALPDASIADLRPGSGVTAPIPQNVVEGHYTTKARREGITGASLVSVIVDAYGMPQNPRIVKSLDPGLDEQALKAVMKYRFKPAMRNGQPVPVLITVEVNFRLR